MSSATMEVEAMDPKILTELQRQEAASLICPMGTSSRSSMVGGPSSRSGRAVTRTPPAPPARLSTTDLRPAPGMSGSFSSGPPTRIAASTSVVMPYPPVAFIDDGPGMLPEMARYALSWAARRTLMARPGSGGSVSVSPTRASIRLGASRSIHALPPGSPGPAPSSTSTR